MYILFDTKSANLVGEFDSEADALRVVRESVEAYGSAYAREWVLEQEDAAGTSTILAEGPRLIRRAGQRPSSRRMVEA